MQTKTLRSDLLLLVAAFLWGTTFVAQRMGMNHLGPMSYNALRFAVGALTLLPIALVLRGNGPEIRSGRRTRFPIWGSALAGLVLFGGASMQQIGLVYTTAGKAGFITNLYVVLVPLGGLLLGHRCGPAVWTGIGLVVTGLYLLTATESSTIGRGDLFVLTGTFFWAVHVHLIGHLAKRANPLHTAGIQFLTCSVLSVLAAVLFEQISLSAIRAATIPILYAGILSVAVAFTLQIVCQRTSPPAHAAIVMSLETIFAALAGYLILGEHLTTRNLIGCALMLAGLLVVQLPLLLGSPADRGTEPNGSPTPVHRL
jgi:drug/metabolite transporter (DMT)-like permease